MSPFLPNNVISKCLEMRIPLLIVLLNLFIKRPIILSHILNLWIQSWSCSASVEYRIYPYLHSYYSGSNTMSNGSFESLQTWIFGLTAHPTIFQRWKATYHENGVHLVTRSSLNHVCSIHRIWQITKSWSHSWIRSIVVRSMKSSASTFRSRK